MKTIFTISFVFVSLNCLPQSKNFLAFRPTANFTISLTGLALNDAGFGLGIDVSLFSTHKLNPLIEVSTDYFVGDKLLIIDPATGQHAKQPAAWSAKLGGQYFLRKWLAVSGTVGPSWYVVRDFNYSSDISFKFGIITLAGSRRRLAAKFFYNAIHGDQKIQYVGIGIGVAI